MESKARQDRPLWALAIALIAGISAAVAAMFVPARIFEMLIAATGISATATPLSDTARAATAFGAGALTLAAVMLAMLRRDPDVEQVDRNAAGIPETDDDLTSTWHERWVALGLPSLKLPWIKRPKEDPDVTELPKLRYGDGHPDAPPRHPLSASQDLPVVDMSAKMVAPAIEPPIDSTSAATPIEQLAVAAEPIDAQPSLAEMVAQLELSVANRHQQLAELEIVAEKLAAQKADSVSAAEDAPLELATASEAEPVFADEHPRHTRPVLEVVPSSASDEDDMDAALAAALATLQRMNNTAG